MSLFSDPDDSGYTASLDHSSLAMAAHSTGCWFALPALGCLFGAVWMAIASPIFAFRPDDNNVIIFGSAPWWQIATCLGMGALGVGSAVMSIMAFQISRKHTRIARQMQWLHGVLIDTHITQPDIWDLDPEPSQINSDCDKITELEARIQKLEDKHKPPHTPDPIARHLEL